MPTRILEPYMRYIDNLEIRFQIGRKVRRTHRDVCSIPQGCPFSMAMVALLILPWVNQMRKLGVKPRCLADDLMITARGYGHKARCIRAMHASREYFIAIGAKIAENKCFTFASDEVTRQYLRKCEWDARGTRIPVCNNFRDLGTHVNLTANLNGATIIERMAKATRMARRLRYARIPRESKERIVQCNILPAGLYGAEAARISSSGLATLRSAIADAIGPSSAKRSVDMVFSCTKCANDLDPANYVLYNRAAALRRIMAKRDDQSDVVKLIISKYMLLAYEHASKHEANPYTVFIQPARGLVGFLMQDLRQCGYELDNDLIISFRKKKLPRRAVHQLMEYTMATFQKGYD